MRKSHLSEKTLGRGNINLAIGRRSGGREGEIMKSAKFINLNLAEKLRDPEYREQFFLAEASATLADREPMV